MEEWKDIKGYEGYYQISSYGNVKSLDRICKNGNGFFLKKGCYLKQIKDRNGYLCVVLQKHGSRKFKLIHRLVAEEFIKKDEGKNEINHKDENKSNNHFSNLEWCSRSYNMNYGSRPYTNSKCVVQMDDDNNIISTYLSISEADRITGINYRNIANCCIGIAKHAGGYKWRFK